MDTQGAHVHAGVYAQARRVYTHVLLDELRKMIRHVTRREGERNRVFGKLSVEEEERDGEKLEAESDGALRARRRKRKTKRLKRMRK